MAEADTTILRRVEIGLSAWDAAPGQVFANPAMMQFRSPVTLGSVGLAYRSESGSTIIEEGSGGAEGCFRAGAYIRPGSCVLWGDAAYANGRRRDVRWCETADRDIIWPYVTADELGGDMKYEIYSFSGGYAGGTGAFSWGAHMAYRAGIHYRDVDPRPRDVTGLLDLSAGGAMRISGRYHLCLSVAYSRYTQSSDIKFVSEMGESRIYHLTGLGTHYVRFDGQGSSSHYAGNIFGATVDLLSAEGSGAFASVALGGGSITQILTDLNKLPLTESMTRRFSAQGGWRWSGSSTAHAVAAGMELSRLRGRKNIFGDPASSVYPQIASADHLADNRRSASLRWISEIRNGSRWRLTLEPAIEMDHRLAVCVGPERLWRIDRLMPSAGASWLWRPSERLLTTLSGDVRWISPLRRELDAPEPSDDDIDGMLAGALRHDFDIASHGATLTGISASALHTIGRRYAIGLTVAYTHGHYAGGVTTDAVDLSLNLYF